MSFSEDAPLLPVGTVVRVYRTSAATPHCFQDPDTDLYVTGFSLDEFVIGTVRERMGDSSYRVTVLRDGRETYINWMSRHWVRLPTEPAPGEAELGTVAAFDPYSAR